MNFFGYSFLLVVLVGSLFVDQAFGQVFDSRNITASEWTCTPGLLVNFDNTTVDCGSEVFQLPAQTFPNVRFPTANATAQYTLIIVDRDARSAANPTVSPIRHAAFANIAGSLLIAGFNATTLGGAQNVSNYRGPQPPAGTDCHRYYLMLYSQSGAVAPLANATTNANWNFVEWAAQSNLTKVAVNFFQTQNQSQRVLSCEALATQSPTPTTVAPTTAAPTTAAPTTAAPTTAAPTVAPTAAPTTAAPTVAPTAAPTTAAPTTAPPTLPPATSAPSTPAPTTAAPPATNPPATNPPSGRNVVNINFAGLLSGR
eukprot:TRINITY_DN1146_c0_g1_i3.p1 TRINITY_DN1146_c0_g1~~TRINITY_DN1146_c0_g1_i3.p1  ORF type:complete len:313 (-),score=143.66 TRINITY_DN1146_c0_g1_i3:133-1071(-)